MKLDNRIWVLITVVLSGAILAAAWFLGVDPQLQAMSTASAQLASVQSANQAARSQVNALQAKNDELPQLTSQLRELQKSVPPGVAGAAFIGELNTMASSNGVQLTNLTLGAPQAYAPPVAEASAATPSAGSTPAPSSSASPSPSPAATPSTPALDPKISPVTDGLITADNFVLVPVDLEVAGSQDGVLGFLKSLQRGPRLLLVTTLDTQEENKGASRKLKVSGFVYVLRQSTAATTAAANG